MIYVLKCYVIMAWNLQINEYKYIIYIKYVIILIKYTMYEFSCLEK